MSSFFLMSFLFILDVYLCELKCSNSIHRHHCEQKCVCLFLLPVLFCIFPHAHVVSLIRSVCFLSYSSLNRKGSLTFQCSVWVRTGPLLFWYLCLWWFSENFFWCVLVKGSCQKRELFSFLLKNCYILLSVFSISENLYLPPRKTTIGKYWKLFNIQLSYDH